MKDTSHITFYFSSRAVPLKFVVITKKLSTFKGFILEEVFCYKSYFSIIRRSMQQNCYFLSGQVRKFTATPLGVLQGYVGLTLSYW
jgi:hypothetical protein